MTARRVSVDVVLLVVTAGLLGAGGIALLLASETVSAVLWAAAVGVTVLPAASWALADLRRGRYGADLLAVLALVGTLAVGEFLAGAVVALMVATGRALEARAGRRARADLSGLLKRAPVKVHLRRHQRLETVSAGQVVPGDRVVVFPGEIVPVDGELAGDGDFDESALTGESAVVSRASGEQVRSGVANTGATADIIATASVAESTFAGIVRLAEQAAADTAPIARIADRIAVWFLPVALLIAAAAWLVSGDAVRAVAVLVTATPCPLLLAVPVAVTAGMSRMARAGVVVKSGAALELLGQARSIVMDKTGTVTEGRPDVVDIVCAPGVSIDEVLSSAAGVEQFSPHVLGTAVVRAATAAGVALASAEAVTEEPGRGAEGIVAGRRVRVGKLSSETTLPGWAQAALRRGGLDLATLIWIRFDEEVVAALLVQDRIRSDAPRTLRRLHAVGIGRLVLLTGDRVDNAQEVADMLDLDAVQAEATPADKIDRIRTEREAGITVMIGDGVNDAPALAAADIGIAIRTAGSTAAAQAADAVIMDGRISRVADAVDIARRSRRLALQSALIGMTLSLLAMTCAAAGWLVPVLGAVVQEGIDVAVILNALRALRQPAARNQPSDTDALVRRFADEHVGLRAARGAVRRAADALATGPGPATDAAVSEADDVLVNQLLPHEHAEEAILYPAIQNALGSAEATVTMSREHAEIDRLARRLHRHLESANGAISADQVDDLRATLYGLDAILTLHFAQEEEAYFPLNQS